MYRDELMSEIDTFSTTLVHPKSGKPYYQSTMVVGGITVIAEDEVEDDSRRACLKQATKRKIQQLKEDGRYQRFVMEMLHAGIFGRR